MTAPAGDAPAIDVRGLNKHFGDKHVVQDLTLRANRGEILGFLGPNGSGKTTSIRMMCGLLTPDSGSGTCLGYDIRTESDQIKRRVGYMTQRFSFWEDLSIRENLDFIARIYEMPSRQQAVDRAIEGLEPDRARDAAGGRAVGRLEAAPRAGRLHAAPARAAAARRAHGGRGPQARAASSGRSCTRSRRAASRSSSARTTWTRPSAATSSPTSRSAI